MGGSTHLRSGAVLLVIDAEGIVVGLATVPLDHHAGHVATGDHPASPGPQASTPEPPAAPWKTMGAGAPHGPINRLGYGSTLTSQCPWSRPP